MKVGDIVTIKSKRRMMQHTGRVVRSNDEEIVITNGFETVRIRLRDWDIKQVKQ